MIEVAADLARTQLLRGQVVRFRARGDSMWPFLRDGDLLVVDPTQVARLGDVVLLRTGPFGVAHRVIAKGIGRVLVKGDSLPRPDGVYDDTEVLGVVSEISRNGRKSQARRRRAIPYSAAVGALSLPRVGRKLRQLLGGLRRTYFQ